MVNIDIKGLEQIRSLIYSFPEVFVNLRSQKIAQMNSNSDFMTHSADTSNKEFIDLKPSSESSMQESDFLFFEGFSKELEKLAAPEEKLRFALNYMRTCLEHRGGPYFRDFWESRKICLPLFKEALPRPIKSQLWEEYIVLTREGRRLKSLLDEETAFAVEQIDLAIKSIEDDLLQYEENPKSHLESIPLEIPPVEALKDNHDQYFYIQSELNFLNTAATKVHAMRKELLKQEMRIRQKNQFFQRLSALGDRVFPKRRELIKKQSDLFLSDVAAFVSAYFSPEVFTPESARRNVFFFREEIKALQSVAKLLTLNTHVFTSTREQLSQCWDKLKGVEKELKKEMSEMKTKSQENAALVRQKLSEFTERIKSTPIESGEALKDLSEIATFMRGIDLVRDDVRKLKDELSSLREPFEQKQNLEEQDRKKRLEDLELKRKEKIEEVRRSILAIQEEVSSLDLQSLRKKWEEAKAEVASLKAGKGEKMPLEGELKKIRDLISEKERQALLSLSGEDLLNLESLERLLAERKVHRTEIKTQVEDLRLQVGSSGLDFEKAITLSSQLAEEKDRLENIDKSIHEIEQKIRDLKGSNCSRGPR